MRATKNRKLFVNLPVADLERTTAFFAELGFAFDPRFTDEKATCMLIGEDAYAMLLTRPFFQTFTKKEICDTASHVEGLFALSCESREEVDRLVRTALSAGGSPAMDPVDHGFMVGWSFRDPDGHHWEVLWMDPAALEG